MKHTIVKYCASVIVDECYYSLLLVCVCESLVARRLASTPALPVQMIAHVYFNVDFMYKQTRELANVLASMLVSALNFRSAIISASCSFQR